MAAERSIDLAGANDFSVYVLPFDGSDFSAQGGPASGWKDPAELVKSSPGKLAELLGKTRKALDHYFNRYLGKGDFDKQKANLRLILGKIRNLWSPIERAYWLRELSHKTGLPEKQLVEEMERLVTIYEGEATSEVSGETKRKVGRAELICERLLSLTNAIEDWRREVEPYLQFMPPTYQTVYRVLGGTSPASPDIKEILDIVSLQTFEEKEERVRKEFEALLRELELEFLNRKQQEMSKYILQAESLANEEELMTRLKEFDDISRRIQYVKNGKKS